MEEDEVWFLSREALPKSVELREGETKSESLVRLMKSDEDVGTSNGRAYSFSAQGPGASAEPVSVVFEIVIAALSDSKHDSSTSAFSKAAALSGKHRRSISRSGTTHQLLWPSLSGSSSTLDS